MTSEWAICMSILVLGGGRVGHTGLFLWDRVALLSAHTEAQCAPPGGPGPWLRNWPLAVGGLLDSTSAASWLSRTLGHRAVPA